MIFFIFYNCLFLGSTNNLKKSKKTILVNVLNNDCISLLLYLTCYCTVLYLTVKYKIKLITNTRNKPLFFVVSYMIFFFVENFSFNLGLSSHSFYIHCIIFLSDAIVVIYFTGTRILEMIILFSYDVSIAIYKAL